jgi:hypothetical protein
VGSVGEWVRVCGGGVSAERVLPSLG